MMNMSEYCASGNGTFFASWMVKIVASLISGGLIIQEVIMELPNTEIVVEQFNREVILK